MTATATKQKKVQSPEHKAASDASKKAFTVKIDKGVMIVTCPVIERESSTGKTIIVANGKKQIAYNDEIINVSLNSYYYNENYVDEG